MQQSRYLHFWMCLSTILALIHNLYDSEQSSDPSEITLTTKLRSLAFSRVFFLAIISGFVEFTEERQSLRRFQIHV